MTLLGGAALHGCASDRAPVPTRDRIFNVVAPNEITAIAPERTGYLFCNMQIAESLLNADDRGAPTPGLASRWQASNDRQTWHFVLRPDARFHDGHAVSPASVVAALRRAQRWSGPLQLARITTIMPAADGVTFRLEAPSALLPAVLAHYSTAIYAPASFDRTGKTIAVIGSGPFAMTAITNQGFGVRAADTWAGARPAIARAHYLSASRAETRAVFAESGRSDMTFELDPATLSQLRTMRSVVVKSTFVARTIVLNPNCAHPFLADVRARQALSLAIDRAGIAADILRDPSRVATQLFSPVMHGWHTPSLSPLTQNARRAALLLRELGWQRDTDGILQRAGQRFTIRLLTYDSRPDLATIAVAIQGQLRAVGIDASVAIDSESAIPAAHRNGSMELTLMARSYVNIVNPVGTLLLDYASPVTDWGAMGWYDPRVATALHELATGAGAGRDDELRAHIATTLHAELPVIPIAWYRLQVAAGADVTNVTIDPFERSYRLSSMRWA